MPGPLTLVGRVISNREMNKTAKVMVTRLMEHRVTAKVMKMRKKYLVHDETDSRMPGDVVRIQESKTISKRKHFTIVDIVHEEPRFLDPISGKTITRFC